MSNFNNSRRNSHHHQQQQPGDAEMSSGYNYQHQQPQHHQQPQYTYQPQYQQQQQNGYGQPPPPQPQNDPLLDPTPGAPNRDQQASPLMSHNNDGTSSGYGDYNSGGGGPSVVEGVPIYPDGTDPKLQKRFRVGGYRDLWAAIAFIVQLLATIGWAVYSLVYIANDDDNTPATPTPGGLLSTPTPTTASSAQKEKQLKEAMMIYLPIATVAALGAVLLSLALMRLQPRKYIWIANIAVIVLNVAFALYLIVGLGAIFFGIIFLIFALINALWLWCVRHRIPFAGVLLENSVRVVTRHYGSVVTSFGSIAVALAYFAVFILAALPSLLEFARKDSSSNNDSSNSAVTSAPGTKADKEEDNRISFAAYLLLLLALLLFHWTTQVIANVVHVTASGTVATWYFIGEDFRDRMPSNPSLLAFKRATTTSFGSICFGSLIVAILKVIHFIVRRATEGENAFVRCIALFIVGCIERLMEYFNVYAFTYVAIYGSSYIEAAKQVWELIKKCVFAAVFNDSLVYPVLNLTTIFNSLIIGVALGFTAYFQYDKSVSIGVTIGILSLIISVIIHILVLRVVYSGVVTIFVCVAEAADVMGQNNVELAAEVRTALETMKKGCC